MSRFFGRQRGLGPGGQAGEPTIPVATVQGQDHGGRLGGVGHGHGAQKVGARGFSLMLWLRLHGVDLVTMALMGALGLGIYEAPPAPSRSFPVYSIDGNVVYPQFAYPLRKEVVPIWLAALLAFLVPWVFFTLFQLRRRSMNDYLTTIMGLLKSLITAAVFQVWIKWLIGGLRPHFLAVCKPNVPTSGAQRGNGFANIMYDRTICTGDQKEINDSLESFPSGHSTAAFAGFIYLSLYLNAQLKVISAHNPAYWKMILFFCPILGAVLIAGALTIDEYHNWYDVVFGGMIGTFTALIAFRQTFASIFDFRFNHVLLPRTTSLFRSRRTLSSSATGLGGAYYAYDGLAGVGAGAGAGLGRTEMYPFTREGGWGSDAEGYVGAPGDASVLVAGARGLQQFGGGNGVMGMEGGHGGHGIGRRGVENTNLNGANAA